MIHPGVRVETRFRIFCDPDVDPRIVSGARKKAMLARPATQKGFSVALS